MDTSKPEFFIFFSRGIQKILPPRLFPSQRHKRYDQVSLNNPQRKNAATATKTLCVLKLVTRFSQLSKTGYLLSMSTSFLLTQAR
jgi:hypothetical protein